MRAFDGDAYKRAREREAARGRIWWGQVERGRAAALALVGGTCVALIVGAIGLLVWALA